MKLTDEEFKELATRKPWLDCDYCLLLLACAERCPSGISLKSAEDEVCIWARRNTVPFKKGCLYTVKIYAPTFEAAVREFARRLVK